jgi:uncharacterized protein YndB with AHSA1/START domain
MSDSNEGKTYTQTWELEHPPEKVWRALTEANLLAKWIMSNDMKAIVGHKFTFKTEPSAWWDGIVHCEVLEIVPLKRIRYSWRGGTIDTVVTWTLKPSPSGGTLLSIEQTGFTPETRQAYAGAKMGWDRNVKTLGELLIKGD